MADPRTGRRKDHNLVAIITIGILAVLCGADGFVAIETYGKAHQAWLETFLDLPFGIPSHDTFGRVLGMLEPQELQNSFLAWVSSITEKLGVELIPLHRQSQWLGLTTVVMVRSTRQLWNETSTAVRFYISSLAADALRHNSVIRSHWSIENSLHWVLDVTFNEDASRVRQGFAAENLGLLRRLSVNLLKREPSKLSLKMKRYKAGMDKHFLLQILATSVAQ
jgi:predicted transposase YbfD/YdcC